MGGSSTTTKNTTEPVSSMLQSYTKYLPGLMQATTAQQPGVAMGNYEATKATQDLFDQLNLEQAQKYGVPLAQAGQDVTRSNALAAGDINRQQIEGSGGAAARAADALNRQINPNYYKVQDAASEQAANLLKSINLGGLSGGEQAAVERSLAQSQAGTGNLGLRNQTNALSNAMNFGGAYQQKQQALGQALGAANQTAAGAQNLGFNPTNIALGQPNVSGTGQFGTGTFGATNANTQAGSLGANTQMGNSFMGGIMNRGLANNTQNMQHTDSLMTQIGQGASAIGSVCCFIFLEYGELPWYIRANRDRYYKRNPQIARGYVRMAKWLVPLMRRFSLVKWLVQKTMVDPITKHGAFVRRLGGENHKHIRKFWFNVWNTLGA